ncbi:MAG: extracellular solute-binding protein, partial [Acidobacteria bacterium]
MRNRQRGMTRRRFLATAAATGAVTLLGPGHRPVLAQGAKPTITYWNGLTGADGKVMDDLIGRFTKETGIQIEQQRIVWPDLYAKLQVSVPAGEGPDIALIHTVEIPHFAADGILEVLDDGVVAGKGFRGEDYLQSPWNGGTF